ncbi:MAG: DNA-binding response regulator [Actinobacteria bacterium]|nr:MAG: DNA-binding response regulator [Actinomycetota bacterium]
MLRALIVDDEGPARSELRYLLETTGDVEIVGEATNAREALELIEALDYDIVFLDIEMPGLNGLDFAETMRKRSSVPAVIFVSAYSEHAVKAFELEAVDYLVKPVTADRLRDAVDKVKRGERSRLSRPSDGERKMQINRIPVEKAGKKILLPIEDIIFISSKDDYSYIHTADARYISSTPLRILEERLAENVFYRVHRRFLVNLNMVSEITPMYGGTFTLTVKDNARTQIPVSRRRSSGLKETLGL